MQFFRRNKEEKQEKKSGKKVKDTSTEHDSKNLIEKHNSHSESGNGSKIIDSELSSEEITQIKPSLDTTTFIETYPVSEPFVYVGISQDPEGGTMKYTVIEPILVKSEKQVLIRIRELLKTALQIDVRSFEGTTDSHKYLRKKILEILSRFNVKMPKSTFEKVMYYLNRDLLGYGVIDPLMKDPSIEDISCDGVNIPIYVFHRDYESIPTNIRFLTSELLDSFILRTTYLSGKHISVAEPLIDASLPDGSRIQMTYGTEVTKKGSTFTIRRFKDDPYSIIDLLKFSTLNSEMAALIWFALENKSSVLLSGGTASGKTTTINCFSMFIRPESKIITIEDTPEVNLAHTNWIQSVSRSGLSGVGEVSLFDLLKAALRQRPDFIIVGEVRGAEASTLFQAISTGHAGLSSVHADSVKAVFNRLTSPPMNIPRSLIPSVNLILQQARITIDGKPCRRIISMTEVMGLDTRTNEFITNEVFAHDQNTDSYKYAGRSYLMEKIAKNRGLSADKLKEELEDRELILSWMLHKNIRQYNAVTDIIRRYYFEPDILLNEARTADY